MKNKSQLLSSLALFLTCIFPLYSTDYKPWYGRVLELDTTLDVTLQEFSSVNTPEKNVHRNEFDAFINLDTSLTVWEGIAAELEIIAAATKQHNFGMDAIRLTGRYRFLNDIVADSLSLSSGITFSTIFADARKNIATFDHGGVAVEGHLAFGKEYSTEQLWTYRGFGVIGFGVADVGSPWIRAHLGMGSNLLDRHQFELNAESIFGLGQNELNVNHFQGYGSVNYQAVDLNMRYSYQLDNGLILSAGYGYRVFAKNAPAQANFILFKLFYPL